MNDVNLDAFHFHTKESPTDHFIVDSCIKIFSIGTESESLIVSYDDSVINDILLARYETEPMELMSVLLNFVEIYNLRPPFPSIILEIRKLFSIGFLIPQFIKNKNMDFLKEISILLAEISKESKEHSDLFIYLAAALSYVLNELLPLYKQFDIMIELDDSYAEIASKLVYLYNSGIKTVQQTNETFLEFFLFILQSLSGEITLTENKSKLLMAILPVVSESMQMFTKKFQFDFKNFAISSLKYFNSTLSIEFKLSIFKLIAKISTVYTEIPSILFTSTNVVLIVKFMEEISNDLNIEIPCDLIKTRNLKQDKPVKFNQLIEIETFEEDIQFIPKSSRQFHLEPPKEWPELSFYRNNSILTSLLNSIFEMFSKQPKDKIVQCHLYLFSQIFNQVQDTSMAVMLLVWIKKLFSLDVNQTIFEYSKYRVLDKILDIALTRYNNEELKRYILGIYPTLINMKPSTYLFMNSFFIIVNKVMIERDLDPIVLQSLRSCFLIDPIELTNSFNMTHFDQRISKLIMDLRQQHINAIMGKEEQSVIDSIKQIRLEIFDFIDTIMCHPIYRNYLLSSVCFVHTLIQLAYEPRVLDYSFFMISNATKTLASRDRSLSSIFHFFQSVLEKATKDSKYEKLGKITMETTTEAFKENTIEVSHVLLHSQFFEYLVKYVEFTESEKDIQFLINIATKCSTMKGVMQNYMLEIDLFSKLQPLISHFFKGSVSQDFINNLWSIVFNNDLTPIEIHPIKNAAPLTLLFNLMKDSVPKFLEFMLYITNCCEENIHSALEVNNSDFPSQLVNIYENFRILTEESKIFDAVSHLFSYLSSYSMKSKDLLTFFHNFSTLPGNFRPYFTIDLLRNLLFIFQTPYDAPSSFYHLNGDRTGLILPDFPSKTPITNWTFFIDIEFLTNCTSGGEFLYLEGHNDTNISFLYRNNQMFYELKVGQRKQQGSFTYHFNLNVWTQISIVYTKARIYMFVHGKEQANISVNSMEFIGGFQVVYVAKSIPCNIGCFGLSQEPQSIQTLKLLAQFPRNSITSFSPAEIQDNSYDFIPLFKGPFHSSLLFIYNPAVSTRDSSINMANVPVRGQMMVIHGRVYGYAPKAKEILRSIGGASSLMPLFAQVDQPVMPKPGTSIEYQFDPTFLPFLIQVLTAFLKDSPANQEQFADMNGFLIVGYLLSRMRLHNITEHVIEMLKRLYNELTNTRLLAQFLDCIFFDIRLWIYLPFEFQMKVYQMILEIFTNSQPQRKLWFTYVIPFSKVLYIMRVFFWTKFSDPQICMFNKPKINKATEEIEGKRPENIVAIRDIFWKLAISIFTVNFQASSAEHLCFFSFDQNDPQMTVETLSFLIQLLRYRNQVLLSVLRTHHSFKSFFPLLSSNDDHLRSQCIHIFYLLHQVDVSLLSDYTEEEWIAGIISSINTSDTTTIFTDLIFGYLFSLFHDQKNPLMPSIRISQIPSNPNNFTFKITQMPLLPLAMLVIVNLPDDICSKYMLAIDRGVAYNANQVYSQPEWYIPFILFLMHRMPNSFSRFDNSSKTCLHTLCSLYGLAAKAEIPIIARLPLYMNLFSSRSRRDYSHIVRMVFIYFLNLKIDLNIRMMCTIYSAIFEYLFVLNDIAIKVSSGAKQLPACTFQELFKYKLNGSPPQINFSYGTRTNFNQVWEDCQLAERFLAFIVTKPEIFTIKMQSSKIDPIFMFSFVLGIGLRHTIHFEIFIPYLQTLTSMIPVQKQTEGQYHAFINGVSGLIRSFMNTTHSHPSHQKMVEISNAFSFLIEMRFKLKSTWGTNVDSFNTRFQMPTYNFCHAILEKFSAIEESIIKYAKKIEKSSSKELAIIAANNQKFASRFERLNADDSTSHLFVKNQQIHIQLHQFAAGVRNKHSEGLKSYRRLWQVLSTEGGPWCPPESHIEHHWKLDKSLQTNYTRSQLVENPKFDDHKEASLMRDIGNLEEVQNQYNEHLKKLRQSKFSGDQSVITITGEESEAEEREGEIFDDSIKFKADANLVTMKRVYSGALLLTRASLIFQGSDSNKHIRIDLMSISQVFLRHYLLLDTAIEIFTNTKRSYFFDFVAGQRQRIIKEIDSLHLPNLEFIQKTAEDIQRLIVQAQRDWSSGKLSNFDYLMKLNVYSGRTYNDLSQYPVFPWVIADYESEELDLSNMDTFRNLTSPIGALNEQRLQQYLDKISDVTDPDMKYLYGSFYSSSAVVIGYMIRIEPFTSLHIELQSGRFDNKNRLFSSIPRAWKSVNETPMDFRELTPEFFYFPDFLVNMNNFDLGVGDVELPPWAKDPYDFISKNRAALESPFVSAMLPRWIDLIFGCSSRGEEALMNNNLYNPYFYDTSVTPEVMKDKHLLDIMRDYAACFGCAPTKIFEEPHKAKSVPVPPITSITNSVTFVGSFGCPILSLETHKSSVICANSKLEVIITDVVAGTQIRNKLLLNAPLEVEDIEKMVNTVQTKFGVAVHSCPWDCAFTISRVGNNNVTLFTKRLHTKPITAVSLGKQYYATGSIDCTVIIWRISFTKAPTPASILSQHRSMITCLQINEKANLLVSCSHDGHIMTTSLSQGLLIKSIVLSEGDPYKVTIFKSGNICVALNTDTNTIVSFDKNLNELGRADFMSDVAAWCPINWKDGNDYLFVAFKAKSLSLFHIPSFKEIWSMPIVDFEATRISMNRQPLSVAIGTQEGKLLLIHFQLPQGKSNKT